MLSNSPSGLKISALNNLEKAISKLPRTKAHQSVHQHLKACLDDFKQYLQTTDSNRQIITEMQAQADRLRFEKQYLIAKHNEILQNIEMLCFQKDYKELQLKIDHYKAKPLEASILTFFTNSLDGDSQTNTLNRSFVIQSSESSRNEFLTSSRLQQLQLECAHHEKEKIRDALKIVTSERQTFETKQEAWLDIVYSKNAQEESLIFNSGNQKTQTSRAELQFSEISLTEACQPPIKNQQNLCYSGKKVKSMVQLKQKSSKKKSLPKTSVKKELENRRFDDNVEFEDDRAMKKKLNFVQLSNQKSSRKRVGKLLEAKQSKSIKKHMGIMG